MPVLLPLLALQVPYRPIRQLLIDLGMIRPEIAPDLGCGPDGLLIERLAQKMLPFEGSLILRSVHVGVHGGVIGFDEFRLFADFNER